MNCQRMSEHIQDVNKGMESPDSPFMKHMTTLIRETGPLTFARFMELALYDEEHGYYMTGGGSSRTTSPIGLEGGDFFTAPSLSPVLAKCLVRQLAEIDERLGHPPVFHLVEMGPGGEGSRPSVVSGNRYSEKRVSIIGQSGTIPPTHRDEMYPRVF